MLRFRYEHEMACSPKYFWELFFDEEWNRGLLRDALGYPNVKIGETVETSSQRRREMTVIPTITAPAIVKRLLGDRFSYHEAGVFDIAAQRWTYETTLSVLPGRFRLGGDVIVKPVGDDACVRVSDLYVESKIPGLSRIAERSAKKNMDDGWDVSARYINAWVRKHPAPAPAGAGASSRESAPGL